MTGVRQAQEGPLGPNIFTNSRSTAQVDVMLQNMNRKPRGSMILSEGVPVVVVVAFSFLFFGGVPVVVLIGSLAFAFQRRDVARLRDVHYTTIFWRVGLIPRP